IGVPHVLGGHHSLNEYLTPVLAMSNEVLPGLRLEHSTEFMLMGISVGGVIISIIYAYTKYIKSGHVPAPDTAERTGLAKISYNKFYLDEIYTAIIQKPLDSLSVFFYKV